MIGYLYESTFLCDKCFADFDKPEKDKYRRALSLGKTCACCKRTAETNPFRKMKEAFFKRVLENEAWRAGFRTTIEYQTKEKEEKKEK